MLFYLIQQCEHNAVRPVHGAEARPNDEVEVTLLLLYLFYFLLTFLMSIENKTTNFFVDSGIVKTCDELNLNPEED